MQIGLRPIPNPYFRMPDRYKEVFPFPIGKTRHTVDRRTAVQSYQRLKIPGTRRSTHSRSTHPADSASLDTSPRPGAPIHNPQSGIRDEPGKALFLLTDPDIPTVTRPCDATHTHATKHFGGKGSGPAMYALDRNPESSILHPISPIPNPQSRIPNGPTF